MLKPLSAGKRKHFLSGWAARHQLQVYKIISHFQAQLLSHSGCLFFAKTNRVEVDNKPSISQSENEFLNAENQFGDLKRSVLKNLCHKAEHAFLEPFFFHADTPAVNIREPQTQALGWLQKYMPVFRATFQGIWISFSFPGLLLDCCTVRLIEYLLVWAYSFNLVNSIANWA